MHRKIVALATVCAVAASNVFAANVDPLVQTGLQLADGTEQKVLEWRRHIHANPELSWQETETARYIAQILATMPGYEIQTGIAGTGVKAVLRGGKPGPVVALRAELDALPVQERNSLQFRSNKKAIYRGQEAFVGHVCGHDTHMAMLLGAARVFSEMRAELPGTVVLIFQPAEEGGPGNGGAVKMVEAGVLDNPKVDLVMGQHITAAGPSGAIAYRSGAVLSSADNFVINLVGKGGHGSSPWASNDPVLAAAEIVQSLQGVISHRINQQDGITVLTIGMLQSGNRTNILPETAEIGGTVRTFSKENQRIVREEITRRAQKIAESHQLKVDVKVGSGGYDMVISDPALTKALVPAFDAAAAHLGVAMESPPSMASDDFSSLTSTGVPSVFWRLYASPFGGKAGVPNHSPEFVVDEAAMKVGVRALVAATVQYMAVAGPRGVSR
ncbi:amidohydrolase [Variovorax paradoxus]|uniref:Amidohydrolase n=1 Tax=Variovorax paradoxus TaxID=34073 RepID=A0AAW8E6T2_VARPD|nr:amidohydrolase [Variovorax paradoxus]MDP9968926.1 amidohydrolase [Variovorax paradoxus]